MALECYAQSCKNEAAFRIKAIPSKKFVNFCRKHTEVLQKMGYIHEVSD